MLPLVTWALPVIWKAIASFYAADPVKAVLTTVDVARGIYRLVRGRKTNDEKQQK